jgi:hypothetical protein
MATVQVFDPPLCCASGACGPQVDPALAQFAADLEWLKSRGVRVERRFAAQPRTVRVALVTCGRSACRRLRMQVQAAVAQCAGRRPPAADSGLAIKRSLQRAARRGEAVTGATPHRPCGAGYRWQKRLPSAADAGAGRRCAARRPPSAYGGLWRLLKY